MQTQTCFDLNAAVENWRNELAAQSQLTPDNRRELEKHLADSMAELRQRGLNEEESFWLGQRRIGRPQQLAEEFVKADQARVWRERIFWMAAAILTLYILGGITISILDFIYSWFPATEKILDQSVADLIIWSLQIITIIALIGRVSERFNRPIKDRARFATVLGCVVLAIKIICTAIMLAAYLRFGGVYSPHGSFVFITKYQLLALLRELGLVAVLVWIMPPKNQNNALSCPSSD